MLRKKPGIAAPLIEMTIRRAIHESSSVALAAMIPAGIAIRTVNVSE